MDRDCFPLIFLYLCMSFIHLVKQRGITFIIWKNQIKNTFFKMIGISHVHNRVLYKHTISFPLHLSLRRQLLTVHLGLIKRHI